MTKKLHLFFLIVFLIALVSCQSQLNNDYLGIYGNWFYFNLDEDSLESYNEIYIDSSVISHHTNMMGTSRNYSYSISNDSIIYLTDDGLPNYTMGIVKSINTDTLSILELKFDGEPYQTLTMIRIEEDSTFKTNWDYDPDNLQLEKSRQRIYFIHRSYKQYLNAGFINHYRYNEMMKDTISIITNSL